MPDSGGGNVYCVVVLFPESDEWKTLLNTYNYYKEIYTRNTASPVNASKSIKTKIFPIS